MVGTGLRCASAAPSVRLVASASCRMAGSSSAALPPRAASASSLALPSAGDRTWRRTPAERAGSPHAQLAPLRAPGSPGRRQRCVGSGQFSADFSVELAENLRAFDALILTGSPVCGLRPVRAARFVTLNEPKPGHETLSPFLAVLTTVSNRAATVRSASALDTPACEATASMSSALVIELPLSHGLECGYSHPSVPLGASTSHAANHTDATIQPVASATRTAVNPCPPTVSATAR